MDRNKAEAALKAVQDRYADWIKFSREDGITDADCYPQLVANYWGTRTQNKPAPFAIVWECNSPDDWAITYAMEQPEGTGVYVDAEFSFVLGIFDDGEFEQHRVKRGAKFVHQRLLTKDDQPETCWITRTTKDMVWYRNGDATAGFLNKCTAGYFAEHVVSFWEE